MNKKLIMFDDAIFVYKKNTNYGITFDVKTFEEIYNKYHNNLPKEIFIGYPKTVLGKIITEVIKLEFNLKLQSIIITSLNSNVRNISRKLNIAYILK